MCNIGIVLGDAGVKLPTAILFMNSNKSERNIRKKVAKAREKCMSQGIVLGHDVVINKGPDRDIDRDAVNMLKRVEIEWNFSVDRGCRQAKAT